MIESSPVISQPEKKNAVARNLTPLKLKQNVSWMFVGNVVYAVSQWGMLTVLAKLGSPEMVGQFALGIAVTTPVIMFANLHLRAIQATDVKYLYHFGDYLGLRLVTTTVALLVIAGITFATGFRWETAIIIVIIGVAKALESISDVFYGLFQQHERMDRIGMSMLVKGPLSLLALGVGVYLTNSVLWGVIALTGVWTLVLIVYDVRSGALILKTKQQTGIIELTESANQTVSRLRPYWNSRKLIQLVRLALPLGIVMMLLSLNTNIPRYFIERQLGEYELGIFAAMAYLMVTGNLVVNSLGQSASPRLAQYYAEANRVASRRLLSRLLAISFFLGVAGIAVSLIAGPQILTLLYRPEYAEYAYVLIWIMAAAGLWYVASVLGYAATAARQIIYQPIALCAVVVVSLGSCYYLIPAYGLWGASISMVAAATVGLLSYLLMLLKRY